MKWRLFCPLSDPCSETGFPAKKGIFSEIFQFFALMNFAKGSKNVAKFSAQNFAKKRENAQNCEIFAERFSHLAGNTSSD